MLWTSSRFSVPLAMGTEREACRMAVIVFPFAHHQLCQQPLSHRWAFVPVSTIRIKAHLSRLYLQTVAQAYG